MVAPSFLKNQQRSPLDLDHSEVDRGTNGSTTFPSRGTRVEPESDAWAVATEAEPTYTPEVSTRPQFDAFMQYGNSTMSYATLQNGMKYFEAHGGYLAYDMCGGRPFVLSDPVAPVERYADIVDAFLRLYPRACFCQVSRTMAEILAARGWFVNEIGCDMELHLPTYDFSGPKKSKLRQAAAKIEREHFTIEELTSEQVDSDEINRLCSAWRESKLNRHELRFLVRPLVLDDETAVRKFYLRDPDGAIVSFVFFDPICEEGEVIGYSPAIKRRSPAAPTGAEEAVTKFAIERFKAEGRRVLRLGLIPLFEINDSEFRHRWLVKKILQFLYKHGDGWVYSFKGHADFKRRYRGTLLKTYCATSYRFDVMSLVGMLRLCRMI